jgi:hypothetical protein
MWEDEYTYKEIAGAFGWTVSSMGVRLTRMRAAGWVLRSRQDDGISAAHQAEEETSMSTPERVRRSP